MASAETELSAATSREQVMNQSPPGNSPTLCPGIRSPAELGLQELQPGLNLPRSVVAVQGDVP